MAERRVIMLGHGPITPDQTKAFTDAVRAAGYGWWHHLPESWLILDGSGTATPANVRSLFLSAAPGVNCLAMKVDPAGWAAYGPTANFEWLHKNL